jgi:hypothetical protein
MEMDYTLYSFDIVSDPGFSSAKVSIFPKEYIRKKKIKNLFNF